MGLIHINDNERTSGDVEFYQRVVVNAEGKKEIVYEGVLVCDDYFEEINTISSAELLIEGVHVFQEKFSTRTDEIEYTFVATKFSYLGGE